MSPGSSVDALEMLLDLEDRGVVVRLTPRGTLRCKPKNALGVEDVKRLKEHKQDLVDFLSSTGQSIKSSPSSPLSPRGDNPDTYRQSAGDNHGDNVGDDHGNIVTISELERKARERADNLGLVARWSSAFGYISIHAPTTGE